jgi:hypothetical protein
MLIGSPGPSAFLPRAKADMNDLRFWHTMDVPGFNQRIADFFCTEYGIQTGQELVEWFENNVSGISHLRVFLTGYIPSTYCEDSEHRGNLELRCHTLERESSSKSCTILIK